MKSARVPALALLLSLAVVSAGPQTHVAAQQPDGISAEALAQIAALLAEKQARTPVEQKIDSQLLYEQKMQSGAPIANGIWTLETDVPYAGDGHIIVDGGLLSNFALDLITERNSPLMNPVGDDPTTPIGNFPPTEIVQLHFPDQGNAVKLLASQIPGLPLRLIDLGPAPP